MSPEGQDALAPALASGLSIGLGIGLPAAFAVFAWWFGTGLVLLLDHLPRRGLRWSLLLSSALALAALTALAVTARTDTTAGAYCAFASALLLWGWHELSFLSGWLTGPRRQAASPGARGWPRLREALAVILWHELALLASLALLLAWTWEAPNPVGGWTFAVLWMMRASAKINLYLGVRNLGADMVPPALAYLPSYFRRRPVNLFFPFAVTAATAVAVAMVAAALHLPLGPAQAAGLMLAGALLGLAILEHWLLVLPLDLNALWRWVLRWRAAPADGVLPHAR